MENENYENEIEILEDVAKEIESKFPKSDNENLQFVQKTYRFETAISKLMGGKKYSVAEKVPECADLEEAKTICADLNTDIMKVIKRGLDILIRDKVVNEVKKEKEKIEQERIKELGIDLNV